ncbi:MAG: SPFH domain-containing protein [Oscillospiraceae bacterium]
MGLIKMFTSAVGSNLADQVVEYFRCDGMSNDTMCIPATRVLRGKAQNKGTADYISSGSTFDVAVGQAALLVEDGKVWDMVVALDNDGAGHYKYDSSTAPSILGSGFKDLMPSIKDIGNRFTAGGQATHTMRLVYINLKPLSGNKIGFGKVPYRDGEMNITINAQGHGEFEIKIFDPGAFYENCIHDISKPFIRSDGDGFTFINQLKTDMKPKFGISLSRISAKRIPYDQLIGYPEVLEDEMKQVLNELWAVKGISVEKISIELNVDDESKARIAKFQEARTAGSDPSMLYAMDRMSINKARETAAGNSAGAMTGFMGMGMAGGGMMGQPMDPTMYNQQMQQNMMMNQQAMYNQQPQQAAPAPAPAQAAPSADSWTCECGETNTGKFCQGCGKPKPAPKPAADTWTCSCGAQNTGKFCIECGKPQPAPAADGWTCSCGAVNKGKFCPQCGAKKPADAPLYKCDKCGWEPKDPKNPPKFCPECGDPFDDNDIQ